MALFRNPVLDVSDQFLLSARRQAWIFVDRRAKLLDLRLAFRVLGQLCGPTTYVAKRRFPVEK